MQHCRAGCAAAAGPSSSPICLRLRHYKHIHTNTTWHLELTTSTERLQNGFCPTASRRYADPAPPPPWSGFLARGRTQPQALGWLTQMFCLHMLIGLNATRAHFASPRASVHQPQTENVKMWKCGRVPHLPPPSKTSPHIQKPSERQHSDTQGIIVPWTRRNWASLGVTRVGVSSAAFKTLRALWGICSTLTPTAEATATTAATSARLWGTTRNKNNNNSKRGAHFEWIVNNNCCWLFGFCGRQTKVCHIICQFQQIFVFETPLPPLDTHPHRQSSPANVIFHINAFYFSGLAVGFCVLGTWSWVEFLFALSIFFYFFLTGHLPLTSLMSWQWSSSDFMPFIMFIILGSSISDG